MGLDLGDRFSRYSEMACETGVIAEGRLRTTPEDIQRQFAGREPLSIVMEVGTHSPWASRLLQQWGHEVLVANPRRVRLIYANDSKNDKVDAETLARLGRLDPKLLSPIRHRGETAHIDLARLRARDSLVRARTQLVNHVRGAVKTPRRPAPLDFHPGLHSPGGTSHPREPPARPSATARHDRGAQPADPCQRA